MTPPITDEMVEAAAQARWDYGRAETGDTTEWEMRHPAFRAFDFDSMRAALEVVAPLIAAKVLRYTDESLARAASQVDTLHHFHGFKCLCGFEGDARARTQTEHITSMMLDTNASVRADHIERGES